MKALEFGGKFTPAVRERMRAKRLELGASLQALGEKLGVHASTLRKWEAGEIHDCHGQNQVRVRRFLRGEYDAAVTAASAPDCTEKRQLPPELRLLMARMQKLYGLCRHYPGMGERMVSAFAETYRRMVRELHQACGLQAEQ